MALSKRSKKRANKTRKHDLGSTLLTENSPWPVQEAYKALRTNLSFMLPGSECKVVCVTSGFPGDGKSSNIVNIAVSFADIGNKVLLLDSDMRLPTLNRKVGVNGIPGLADLLTGKSTASEVLQRNVHGYRNSRSRQHRFLRLRQLRTVHLRMPYRRPSGEPHPGRSHGRPLRSR